MPTVLAVQGFRFFFYSNEGDEPRHIHVEKAESFGKIWLEPTVEIAYMSNFSVREVRQIINIVNSNLGLLIEKWDEHFG
ncbi:MAG TPA: DUF4160 domain-containing protein [Puia sp.]|nr:DUF4160 domain-containing protein [Puia sp.]